MKEYHLLINSKLPKAYQLIKELLNPNYQLYNTSHLLLHQQKRLKNYFPQEFRQNK